MSAGWPPIVATSLSRTGDLEMSKMAKLLCSLVLSASLAVLPAKASAAAQSAAARLVGAWRLVSATERMADGTERPDPNVGAQGRGYIVYTATGQVCAMLGNSQRPRWAVAKPTAAEASAITENMVAYCGTYSVDEAGGFVVHHVEIDLSPNLTGTDRKRFFTITGDRLVLRAAPPLPEGVQALTITWERVH
jgi:hypothetical protein